MCEALVSIIVPIYNVRKYVYRCIDSLVKQTYKNLQIICIDDGSTDESFSIVSSISDDRIEVVSKKNGGLSSARNCGLKYVKGSFVLFVDSDDWVESDYVRRLLMQFNDDCVDIACVGFDYAYDDHREMYEYPIKDRVFSSKQALNVLCAGKIITNHVWNKMYRVEILNDISFEEGRKFEDIYIMHQLFIKSRKVSMNSEVLYHYYMRNDSILHEEQPQNIADIAVGYIRRFYEVRGFWPKFFTLRKCAWASYQVLYLIKDKKRISNEDYESIRLFWKKQWEIVLFGGKYFMMYVMPKQYRKKINHE